MTKYVTLTVYAETHNLVRETLQKWLTQGRIAGAYQPGGPETPWIIPSDTPVPEKRQAGRPKSKTGSGL